MATNVKVLLKSNVENLGSGGDIVKVRPGFARNFLLPRGFAVPATPGNLQRVEELRRHAATQAQEELGRAKELEVRIGAVSVQIERAAGDEDRMWGSVTSRDVAEAFARVGVEVRPEEDRAEGSDQDVRPRRALDPPPPRRPRRSEN